MGGQHIRALEGQWTHTFLGFGVAALGGENAGWGKDGTWKDFAKDCNHVGLIHEAQRSLCTPYSMPNLPEIGHLGTSCCQW